MDKNNLKTFARQLRNRIREMTGVKINYYLTGEDIEIKYRQKQINELKKEIDSTGLDGVIEKVSYIWFNRFVALRFMELKGYTKSRILSPLPERTVPEILEQAKGGLIDNELRIDRDKINDLLDGKIKSRDPEEEVYRMLVTTVCNYYHKIMPFMFEWIDDYTELLIPENLLKAGSVRDEIVKNISENDCEDVEIIGWLYQYYISEKNEEVDKKIKKGKKVEKDEIPCYTQMFTPKWIVKYMVENSLGRLWLEAKPDPIIKGDMKYFVKTEDVEERSISSPELITVFDPCCGSGHILVYAFDLLTKIYEEEGYNKSEIPELILKNNLWGIDIDDRAASLASFALIMKARGYYARFFKKPIKPNVISMKDINFSYEEKESINKYFGQDIFSGNLGDVIDKFRFAKNYGSLIHVSRDINIEKLLKKAEDMKKEEDLFYKELGNKIESLFRQMSLLSRDYDCVITNPPYMGNRNINPELADFIKEYYPDSKLDLCTCFIEKCLILTKKKGYNGMITLPSWLFISTFENLRLKIIDNYQFSSMLHMGRGIFGIDWGSVSTVIKNELPSDTKKTFYRLHKRVFQHIYYEDIEKIFLYAKNDENYKFDFDSYRDANGTNEIPVSSNKNGEKILFKAAQQAFKKIPGSPIAYWASDKTRKIFKENINLGKIAEPRQGMTTSDNNRFLRLWYEVKVNTIGFGFHNSECAMESNFKWFPYNKGGDYRKWFGNNEYIVNYENDGHELKEFHYELNKTSQGGRLKNREYYFRPSITWSFISSTNFGVRYSPEGFIFDVGGSSVFPPSYLIYYLLSYLSSVLTSQFLKILNPTLNYQVLDIKRLPIICSEDKELTTKINNITEENIINSRIDWNSRETSWNFRENPLLNFIKQTNREPLEAIYNQWKSFTTEQFHTLHKNEEELNKIFIEIYGLQDELTPDVELKDITILIDETFINDRGELEFKPDEVMKQFISYCVGCIFGRYSLDKEGLILANQGETFEDYIKIINKTPSFTPDKDNILPVLSDEYFENDIVSLFNRFLKITFGEYTFHENLAFIEEKLGKSIRAYFEKDFYSDHIKRYKKRPIYWLFQSPKKHFQALIYMHRYTPDLCSKVLNDYLREYSAKQEYRKVQIKKDIDSDTLSGKEKTRKEKEIKEIDKILKDLAEYDKKLDHMAKQYLSIDLDDGVRVNYCKFKDVLATIAGLEKE